MAITSLTARRIGGVTLATAVSDLDAPIYFHWFVDGAYVGMTRWGAHSFSIAADAQARIDVVDTNDLDFDPLVDAPVAFPARVTIQWIRSLSLDVEEYAIEHAVDAGPWAEIARLPHRPDQWSYRVLSDRLADLSSHTFRVLAYDRAGNVNEAVDSIGLFLVRVPDSPRWSYTYNPTTDRVTFAAA